MPRRQSRERVFADRTPGGWLLNPKFLAVLLDAGERGRVYLEYANLYPLI